MVFMAPVGAAGVDRYQITTVDYTLDYEIGGATHTQTFRVVVNPCDGTFSGAGNQPTWGDTWTEGSIGDGLISYETDYVVLGLPYTVTVNDATLESDGYSFSGTWSDTRGNTNQVVTATAVVFSTTNYKNHGQYVADHLSDDAPHSCMGMPITSKGKTK